MQEIIGKLTLSFRFAPKRHVIRKKTHAQQSMNLLLNDILICIVIVPVYGMDIKLITVSLMNTS